MRRLLTGIAVLGLSLLTGCSDSTSASQPGSAGDSAPFNVPGEPVRTATVDLPKSYTFEPAVIQVAPGTTVTWTNRDDFPHNIRLRSGADAETSKNVGIGESASITFAEEGTYYYDCSLHPAQMKGKVIVAM